MKAEDMYLKYLLIMSIQVCLAAPSRLSLAEINKGLSRENVNFIHNLHVEYTNILSRAPCITYILKSIHQEDLMLIPLTKIDYNELLKNQVLRVKYYMQHKMSCDEEQAEIDSIVQSVMAMNDAHVNYMQLLFRINGRSVSTPSRITQATSIAKHVTPGLLHSFIYEKLGITSIEILSGNTMSAKSLQEITIINLEKWPGWKLFVTGEESAEKKICKKLFHRAQKEEQSRSTLFWACYPRKRSLPWEVYIEKLRSS